MLLRWDLFLFFLFLVGEICLQPRILQAKNLSDDLNLDEPFEYHIVTIFKYLLKSNISDRI